MAQINPLLNTLKKALKAHGLTYLKIAEALDLSEVSVKRLFAEQTFSLQRLEQICQLMDMEISDLVQMMNEQQPRLQHLSIEQEKEITQDLVLLLITVSVLNRWTMQDILTFYKFSESECIQKLARLDKLKIVELLPKNKISSLLRLISAGEKTAPSSNSFRKKLLPSILKRNLTMIMNVCSY
jgi:DNA-binding Xre family transcriptional regulator